MEKEMDNAKDRPPFELLDGEEPAAQSVLLEQFLFPQLGFSSNQPRIYVTNYRVRVVLADDPELFQRDFFQRVADIPLGAIKALTSTGFKRGYGYGMSYFSTPSNDFTLELKTKDVRVIILKFKTDVDREATEALIRSRAFFRDAPLKLVDDENYIERFQKSIFAYKHFSSRLVYKGERVELFPTEPFYYSVEKEFKRLGLNADSYQIAKFNEEFALCPSYPKHFILPANITLEVAQGSAKFRTNSRIPALVWVHPRSGVTLSRCSQPKTGMTSVSIHDEALVESLIPGNQSKDLALFNNANSEAQSLSLYQSSAKYLTNVTASTATLPPGDPANVKLVIIDARSKMVAGANVMKGGGYESAERYAGSNIQFMDIGNIHDMRSSHRSLLSWMTSPGQYDRIAIEHTQWPKHCHMVLMAARNVAEILDSRNQSVLVHCSDGWDRTAQIVTTAQVLIDPFYRTLHGFAILIQKDWIAFGHRFLDRIGHGEPEDTSSHSEQSPIFLQWIEVIYQLLAQFQNWFEFTEDFLIAIVDEVFACQFGDFLFNNEKESLDCKTDDMSRTLWQHLLSPENISKYRNPDFKAYDKVIKPETSTSHLQVWVGFYERYRESMLLKHTYKQDTRQAREQFDTLSAENESLKHRLEDAERLLQELIRKDPTLLKGVQDRLERVVSSGGNNRELSFELIEDQSGHKSAFVRDESIDDLGDTGELEYVTRFTSGSCSDLSLNIHEDYAPSPSSPRASKSPRHNPNTNQNTNSNKNSSAAIRYQEEYSPGSEASPVRRVSHGAQPRSLMRANDNSSVHKRFKTYFHGESSRSYLQTVLTPSMQYLGALSVLLPKWSTHLYLSVSYDTVASWLAGFSQPK